jgi:hypothetical protein
MRNAIQSLLNAIDREAGGVAVVRCPDLGIRAWLVEQVESLFPDDVAALRVGDVEAALREPDRLVLLIPQEELNVVLDLDASRDRMLEGPARSQPIVLFLLRDGDGERALASEAPSLRSWISGSDVDPEALAEIDIVRERGGFEAVHRETPEVWLERWRTGTLDMTAANFRTAFDASLLEIAEER